MLPVVAPPTAVALRGAVGGPEAPAVPEVAIGSRAPRPTTTTATGVVRRRRTRTPPAPTAQLPRTKESPGGRLGEHRPGVHGRIGGISLSVAVAPAAHHCVDRDGG